MFMEELSELTSNVTERQAKMHYSSDWLDVGGAHHFIFFYSPCNATVLQNILFIAAGWRKAVGS